MPEKSEIWYTTGSRRMGKQSATAQMLSRSLSPQRSQRVREGLQGLLDAHEALGDAASRSARSFEDARLAMQALTERHGEAVQSEPTHCAICDEEEGERVKHTLETSFGSLPIWTRVCGACSAMPLCTGHPWGVHPSFVSAQDPDFILAHTVVVDLGDMANFGHCGECGLPLKLLDDGSVTYWTPQERGRLLRDG